MHFIIPKFCTFVLVLKVWQVIGQESIDLSLRINKWNIICFIPGLFQNTVKKIKLTIYLLKYLFFNYLLELRILDLISDCFHSSDHNFFQVAYVLMCLFEIFNYLNFSECFNNFFQMIEWKYVLDCLIQKIKL